MKVLHGWAVICVPGAELVVASVADYLWNYWKSWAAVLKKNIMNNEFMLPYYRGHKGGAVSMFNPSMEKLQWQLKKENVIHLLVTGTWVLLTGIWAWFHPSEWNPLPPPPSPLSLSLFRLFLGLSLPLLVSLNRTLIHYSVQCMQKCPQWHLQNRVEETDKFFENFI